MRVFRQPLEKAADVSLSFANDFRNIPRQGYNTGWIRVQGAAINDHIKARTVSISDGVGIVQAGAGADNRSSQSTDYGEADLVVRHSDPYGLSFGQHDFGNQLCPLQNESIGAGEQSPHGLVCIIGHLGVSAYFLQAVTNDGEGFFERPVFQFVNEYDALFVEKVATDAIKGIRRVGDNTTGFKNLAGPVDQTLLRIMGID